MAGRTFVESFTAKYLGGDETIPSDEASGEASGIIILYPKSRPQACSALRMVVLENEQITSAGDCSEIADNLQGVKELDLSFNRLGSWGQVEEIIRFTPSLEFLNIASTTLGHGSTESVSADCQLRAPVRVLILNSTGVSWEDSLRILSRFPRIEEVHLSLNCFSKIPESSSPLVFGSVCKLYFNDNAVTDWPEVAKLGALFPNMESLFLVDNPLSGLTEDIGTHFPRLEQLSILDTALSSWDEVDNLNCFPKLVGIQMKGIPLLSGMEERECRQLVIARLPRVVRVNNSPISDSEREDAERKFIRAFMDKAVKPRRYEELRAIHQNVHRLAEVDMSLVRDATLTIKYLDEVVTMDFSTQNTCLQLRMAVANHFKLDSDKIRLRYRDARVEEEAAEVLLGGSAKLDWYSMKSGDEILVEEVEVKVHTTFVEAFLDKYIDHLPEDFKLYPNLSMISLNDMKLTTAGNCSRIAEHLKKLVSLDLTGNAFGSWTEVEKILRYMPKISQLNLPNTPLTAPIERTTLELMNSMRILVLARTGLQWTTVIAICESFPRLNEIHLDGNNISAIPQTTPNLSFPALKRLNFSDNWVDSWSDVATLGDTFPNLEALYLDKNPLADLTEDVGGRFKQLKKLSIQSTGISSWDEVSNLNHFPRLVTLNLGRCPLLSRYPSEIDCRKLLEGCLSKVVKINNSFVPETRRSYAQRYFMEQFRDDPNKPKRYEELCAIHGNVD